MGEKLVAGRVWSGANELSEKQRATFVFRFEKEMELSEIALATGMKISTFKSQLYRAVGSIRDGLERSALSAIAERKWLDVEQKPFVVGHVLPFGDCKLGLAASQGEAVRRRKSDRTFLQPREHIRYPSPRTPSASLQWCQARIHIALQRTVRISEDSPLSCRIASSNVHDGKDRLATAI
jgi:hypothetical protein